MNKIVLPLSVFLLAVGSGAVWAQGGPGMNPNSQPGQQPQSMNQPVPAQTPNPAAPSAMPHAMPAPVPTPAAKLAASKPAPQAKGMAQQLVNKIHSQYPELAEIGLSAKKAKGCVTVASTDKKDIGEKCERDAIAPMKTGKTSIEKEGARYAVSLPLRDIHGKVVGSLGLEFKPKPGQTKASILSQAKKIASQMGSKISSQTSLIQ